MPVGETGGAWLVKWYSWAVVKLLLSRRERFSSPEECPGCRAEMMPGQGSPDGVGQAAKATFSCRFEPVTVQWTWNWYKESKCGPLSEWLLLPIQLLGEINSELWSYFLGKKTWLRALPHWGKNPKMSKTDSESGTVHVIFLHVFPVWRLLVKA